jgi:hypothetical protein
MNLVDDFDNLFKTTRTLMHIYWDISDNYRGSCDFASGLFQFIETDEGKKLENNLSALTDQVNAIIDEIICKLNERYNTAGQALQALPAAAFHGKPRGIIPFGSSLARSCPCKHDRDLAPFVSEDVTIKKEDTDTINGSMKYFANDYKSIHWKNVWFGKHKMDLNERAKLNSYFKKLKVKVSLLNKVLTEKKDTLNIMSVNEAFESNMKELENDPEFMNIIKTQYSG